MSKSKDLDAAVLDVIKAGQIGRPVFVRCLVGVPEAREDQKKLFVDLVMNVQIWIGEAIERLVAVGTWGPGLSICVQFRNGASAIVSGEVTREWLTDLIVLGNHGAIYRDAFSGSVAKLARSFPESDSKRAIRAALEAAVESGQPQTVLEANP
jgi:hypothetical protein